MKGKTLGKKRSISVKRVAEMIISRRADSSISDFEDNKKLVNDTIVLHSKAARNKIAGYITHHDHHKISETVLIKRKRDEEDE
ncbi:MAG: 30S ribosomal protein S17e [Candidatus Bathyarchaeota archaeon]